MGLFYLCMVLGVGSDVSYLPVLEKLDGIVVYSVRRDIPTVTTVFEREPEAASRTVREWHDKGCGVFVLRIDKQVLESNLSTLRRRVSEPRSM